MKTNFLLYVMLLVALNLNAQIINVSTGVNNTGNALSAGTVDPNWQIASISNAPGTTAKVSPFYGGFWEPTPTGTLNAGWINASGTIFTNTNGIYTFERPFAVGIGNTTINYNLNAAWDDAFISLEFVKPDGSTIPIVITPNSNPRYLSTSVPNSTVTTLAGTWKIRAVINFVDNVGGFLMAGTITVNTTPCDKWALCGNLIAPTDFIGSLNAQPLNFKTNSLQRMTIQSGGNIGIGTTTPTSQLEVTTTALAIPAVKALGKSVGLYAEATAQQSNLIKRSNQFNDLDGIAIFGDAKYTSTTTNGSMYGVVGSATALTPLNNIGVFGEAKNGSGYNQGIIGYVNSSTGIYNAGVSGQVELNTTATWNRAIYGVAPVAANHFAGYFIGNVAVESGNVVIGNVTKPAGYKLYVEQGILTEKVKVAVATSAAWADYVFANNYKLKPLSAVETFIKENKHLPNVPSASDLVKEGLDLGKMQATQMEKIEELTLYLIEMKKEIEALKIQLSKN